MFTTPDAVELSDWIGEGGCDHPISLSACRRGIISLAVTNNAPSSASAAEERTNFKIWAMLRKVPFQGGRGELSDRKMWAPTRLRPLVSLLNPASE